MRSRYTIGAAANKIIHRQLARAVYRGQWAARRSLPSRRACPQLDDPTDASSQRPSTVHRPVGGSPISATAPGLPAARRSNRRELARTVYRPPSTVGPSYDNSRCLVSSCLPFLMASRPEDSMPYQPLYPAWRHIAIISAVSASSG